MYVCALLLRRARCSRSVRPVTQSKLGRDSTWNGRVVGVCAIVCVRANGTVCVCRRCELFGHVRACAPACNSCEYYTYIASERLCLFGVRDFDLLSDFFSQ